jgi:hypothetical protein
MASVFVMTTMMSSPRLRLRMSEDDACSGSVVVVAASLPFVVDDVVDLVISRREVPAQ